MKQLAFDQDVELRDIKATKISEEELAELRELSGSYESLFSRRAQKFRSEGWNEKVLTEDDYRDLILKEYTFLKRPVAILNDKIFIGNSKQVIEKLRAAL